MGLYASILPLIAYALFGSSRTLSVGPVAVASLMTASAVGSVTAGGNVDYATAATTLALLGGVMLIVLGLLKFGFVANFLSHPVVSGFITASGIIIALGQLGPLMGVSIKGDTLPHLLEDLGSHWVDAHGLTTLIGMCAIGFLLFSRYALTSLLMASGMSERAASLFVRAAPVVIMVVVIPLSYLQGFAEQGVPVVGSVPTGLPAFSKPHLDWVLLEELAMPAFLIAPIGFVESVSVGKTLGAKEAATHRSQSGADRTWRGQYCSGSVGWIPGHGGILAFGGEFRCRCGHANGFHFHCSRYCAGSPAVNAYPLLSSQGSFGGDNHRRGLRVDRLEYPEAICPLLPRRSLRGVTYHTGYVGSRRRTRRTHRCRGIDWIASLSNEHAALCGRWADARLRALPQRKTS